MTNAMAQNYASALFSLAKEEKKVAAYQEALAQVGKAFESNPEYLAFLSSFAIEKKTLYSSLESVFKAPDTPSLVPFLKLLVEKHLIAHYADIEANFDRFANADLGVKTGIVYSASLLQKDEKKMIEEALSKRLSSAVHLDYRVEPQLLGGVKVFIDGRVYDDTLDSKIERLRNNLLKEGGNV
jgi:F-type H+-transporting ATPase subunit delta